MEASFGEDWEGRSKRVRDGKESGRAWKWQAVIVVRGSPYCYWSVLNTVERLGSANSNWDLDRLAAAPSTSRIKPNAMETLDLATLDWFIDRLADLSTYRINIDTMEAAPRKSLKRGKLTCWQRSTTWKENCRSWKWQTITALIGSWFCYWSIYNTVERLKLAYPDWNLGILSERSSSRIKPNALESCRIASSDRGSDRLA